MDEELHTEVHIKQENEEIEPEHHSDNDDNDLLINEHHEVHIKAEPDHPSSYLNELNINDRGEKPIKDKNGKLNKQENGRQSLDDEEVVVVKEYEIIFKEESRDDVIRAPGILINSCQDSKPDTQALR